MNIDSIRADFPILKTILSKQQALIYLDNAATTQKPQPVIDALQQYYSQQNANIHRGIHELAAQATRAYEAVRVQVQQFIKAKSKQEIIFVRGATEGINLVAQSFVAPRLHAGDEVLISAMEHHSNLIPWQMICQQQGAQLKVIPMNKNGELDLGTFEQLLTSKTKILAITHISNALGTVNPIQKMIALAHQKEIPVLIDAAQSIAYYDMNVQDLDCDFLVFSGHKMFGPTGIGVLYGKMKHLDAMQPYQYGGEMIRSVTFEKTTFAKLPHKLEAGTPNIAGTIGLGKAITYIESLDRKAIKHYLQDLLQYATQALEAIEGLTIIGTAADKSCIISFVLKNAHPHDIATILNEDGIAIRAGHHCAQPIMDFFEIAGTARISLSFYNTKEEIDQVVESLENVRTIFQ